MRSLGKCPFRSCPRRFSPDGLATGHVEFVVAYFLRLDPSAPSLIGLPIASYEGEHAFLTVVRRADADDFALQAQFSDSLIQRSIPAVLVTEDNGDGTLTDTWRSLDVMTLRPRLYGRVRVVSP